MARKRRPHRKPSPAGKRKAQDILAVAVLMLGAGGGLLTAFMHEGHQDVDVHDQRQEHRPHYGGITQFVGTHEYELSVAGRELTLWLLRDEKPLQVAGTTATAVLSAEGKEERRFELRAKEGNSWQTQVDAAALPRMRIVTRVNFPGNQVERAEFELK